MFHWNSSVWENTPHCLINAVKKCLLLYLSPECQTQDLKCLQRWMSWMGNGKKEHGLWGQTDQAWTFSLPGEFDLGSCLRTCFYTTDDSSEGSPRMCFPAFMRNCTYQYVMDSLRASLHVRCKDLERGLRYSQGDSGTEEWREGRLERQYLNYSPEHVFYEWMVSQWNLEREGQKQGLAQVFPLSSNLGNEHIRLSTMASVIQPTFLPLCPWLLNSFPMMIQVLPRLS